MACQARPIPIPRRMNETAHAAPAPTAWLPQSPTYHSFGGQKQIALEALVDAKDSEPYHELFQQVRAGLQIHPPELCPEGLSGTYFLRNEAGEIIAVFKPRDEEGSSPKNPKNAMLAGCADPKEGLLPGEGAQREVAAYLLDKEKRFSRVPMTVMVALHHPIFDGTAVHHQREHGVQLKIGSLQEFIKNEGDAEEVGPGQFSVTDTHRIGILDLRIFNNDRHGGNILVTRPNGTEKTLVPIDHSISLSDTLSTSWFEWLFWPQAKVPFSEEELEYIKNIDLEHDVNMLERLGIRKECLRTLRISTTLLMKGAAAGLTLYDIGTMASRLHPDDPCELEMMYDKAMATVQRKSFDEEFFPLLGSIMDDHIEEVLKKTKGLID